MRERLIAGLVAEPGEALGVLEQPNVLEFVRVAHM